jgi:hypothetical protein
VSPAGPATSRVLEVGAIDVPPGGESAVVVARELRAVAKGGGVVLQAGRDIINGNVFTGSRLGRGFPAR